MSPRPIFPTLFAIAAALALLAGVLDAFLRSRNNPTEEDRALGIKTRIGTYTRFEPMGFLPLSLVFAAYQWPDRAACVSDPEKNVLRWADFGTVEDMEICLSRVLANMAEDDDVVATLVANGFAGSEAMQVVGNLSDKVKTRIGGICKENHYPCGAAPGSFLEYTI